MREELRTPGNRPFFHRGGNDISCYRIKWLAGLGEGFTEEVCEAWTLTYTTLSGVMIEASRTELA